METLNNGGSTRRAGNDTRQVSEDGRDGGRERASSTDVTFYVVIAVAVGVLGMIFWKLFGG